MTRGRVWRWLGVALAGLLLYAILLIVFMPAQYFARVVGALNDDVVLQQPAGSLWDGAAVLVAKRLGVKPLGQIRWKIYPWRLFLGSLVADLEFTGEGMDAKGTIEARLKSYLLQRVTATASAPILSQLYPPLALAGVTGRLQLSADTLELKRNEIRGTAELVWNDAASRMVPIEKIGTYRLTLTGEGKHAALLVSTVQGALQIAGRGEWRLLDDGLFRLSGSISSASPQPALDVLLNAVGPAQPNGARAFNIETRLRPLETRRLFL